MVKLFGGKGEEQIPSTSKGFIPTDRVRELSSKGFSEPEMIDVLRKEGFGPEEIDRALTQALKIGVTGGPEETSGLPTLQDLQPPMEEMRQMMPQMPEKPLEYAQSYPEYGTEELVESIVHERMGEVDEKIKEFRFKQAELEREIANLHHQLSVVSKGRSQAEQSIISKLDSFKESMSDIDSRISSLDKAFRETLPALIESVRSLSDLVQRLKREAQ
jgi:DNA-binding transcriptional MerR regulator